MYLDPPAHAVNETEPPRRRPKRLSTPLSPCPPGEKTASGRSAWSARQRSNGGRCRGMYSIRRPHCSEWDAQGSLIWVMTRNLPIRHD